MLCLFIFQFNAWNNIEIRSVKRKKKSFNLTFTPVLGVTLFVSTFDFLSNGCCRLYHENIILTTLLPFKPSISVLWKKYFNICLLWITVYFLRCFFEIKTHAEWSDQTFFTWKEKWTADRNERLKYKWKYMYDSQRCIRYVKLCIYTLLKSITEKNQTNLLIQENSKDYQ